MQEQNKQRNRRIFGFPEEWQDFEKRNALFLERFPHLEQAISLVFATKINLSEPIDKFVFIYGRVCLEDFFEILLCCGNGYGHAGQKLLRGLYERAVTLRYLHENPTAIQDFLDFHKVAQRKLMIACASTMGKDMFEPEMAARIEHEYQAVRDKFMVTDCKACGTRRVGHTWNKLDFAAMARATSLGQLIALGYYIPLREAHATVASMLSRVEESENEGISLKIDAQRKPADNALRVSHNIFLDVLRVQDERFAILGLKEQNEVCLRDFMDIWKGRPPTE